jgi:endonuclease YncB( thermonuclease family)
LIQDIQKAMFKFLIMFLLFMNLLLAALIVLAVCIVLFVENNYNTQRVPECDGYARCFEGTVTKIVDGDTLDVNNVPVRLSLVNAPEYGKAGYDDAKSFIFKACPVGTTAKVDEDDGQNESYGRIMAVVYCNGLNINAEIISSGRATLYREYCDVSEFSKEQWTGC